MTPPEDSERPVRTRSIDIAFPLLFFMSLGTGWLLADNTRVGTLLGWAVGLMILPAIGYLTTRRASPMARINVMTVPWVIGVIVMWSLRWVGG